jgi:beta-lactamase class D
VLDLAGAIRESCVSYFRQTARALGPERMARGLDQLGYPYGGSLEPVDGFWLEGRMRVTPEQQLRWIRRFYTEALRVNPEHLAWVRKASERAPLGAYLLHGKTGASREGHGWFIGQVTQNGAASWYVLLLQGKGASGLEAERRLRVLLKGPT